VVSSVGVAWTRTFRPLTSAMFLISRLEYMLRRPSVESAMTRAPCTVSAIIAFTALATSIASTVLPVPGSPFTSKGRCKVMAALTATLRSSVAT